MYIYKQIYVLNPKPRAGESCGDGTNRPPEYANAECLSGTPHSRKERNVLCHCRGTLLVRKRLAPRILQLAFA